MTSLFFILQITIFSPLHLRKLLENDGFEILTRIYFLLERSLQKTFTLLFLPKKLNTYKKKLATIRI